MNQVDLVLEGGGAKGIAFVGALDALLADGRYTPGRLLGTSAGAIMATFLASGYTVAEMKEALTETDGSGASVFHSFMGPPRPFSADELSDGDLAKLFQDLNLPLVPESVERILDRFLISRWAQNEKSRPFVALMERGGWFSADSFVTWLRQKLNQGSVQGQPRTYGDMNLAQFFAATGCELTLVASDITQARMVLLNHRTAPDCPLVYAVRMSMSIPLVWEEIVWQKSWGAYRGDSLLTGEGGDGGEMVGHIIADGGLLSNFPIALYLADWPRIGDLIGPPLANRVLGLLLDEKLLVPQPQHLMEEVKKVDVSGLRSWQRLQDVLNTCLSGWDNLAMALFAQNIVHLPAAGYGLLEFDMSPARRQALMDAGRAAMTDHLASSRRAFAISDPRTHLANEYVQMLAGHLK